jgi:hypothetical protein
MGRLAPPFVLREFLQELEMVLHQVPHLEAVGHLDSEGRAGRRAQSEDPTSVGRLVTRLDVRRPEKVTLRRVLGSDDHLTAKGADHEAP